MLTARFCVCGGAGATEGADADQLAGWLLRALPGAQPKPKLLALLLVLLLVLV
eukprot:COSAG04_NODE_23744_length_333_cov_0.816239_1_plen_52_part_01